MVRKPNKNSGDIYSSEVSLELISDIAKLDQFEKDWDILLSQTNNSSIVFTIQWLIHWWKSRANPENKRLSILACFEKSELIAIFPFYWSKGTYRGIPIRKLTFMVDSISPHMDFIIRKDKREQAILTLLVYLKRIQKYWDVIILDRFRDTSNRKMFLQFLRIVGFRFGIQPSLRTPIIQADKSWEAYWSERPKRFKRSIKNKLNRIRKVENFSIEQVNEHKEIEKKLHSVFEISSKSWKAKIGTDIRQKPVEYRFYRSFSPAAAKKNRLNIWFLKVNGRAIAYEYHLIYDDIIYPLRADFDESYRSLSPGSILEYSIMRSIFENGNYRSYYSCANDYQYLRNWATEYEQLLRIDIFNNRLISKGLHTIEYRLLPELRRYGITKQIKSRLFRRDIDESR